MHGHTYIKCKPMLVLLMQHYYLESLNPHHGMHCNTSEMKNVLLLIMSYVTVKALPLKKLLIKNI